MARRIRVVEVLGTDTDEAVAEAIMHRCAQRLSEQGQTDRYGVSMRKRFSVWRVELIERLD